jgi:phosphoribosylaminoimidazole-succinocarboxamide synthase
MNAMGRLLGVREVDGVDSEKGKPSRQLVKRAEFLASGLLFPCKHANIRPGGFQPGEFRLVRWPFGQKKSNPESSYLRNVKENKRSMWMTKAVITTECPELQLLHRGKVRDMYGIPGHEDKLLMVATDRISAYDVVMADPIPGKGTVLTRISLFWFNLLGSIMPNHLLSAEIEEFPEICRQYRDQLAGRSMLVKRTRVVPIECIVRGYLSGSFWSSYQKNTTVCGFRLPEGMRESDKFPAPLFTPSTKAEQGLHDENISIERMRQLVGADLTAKMAELSVRLYQEAADYALTKGIIIADTKFEMGMVGDTLTLVDEVLTPDSSRFWPLDLYRAGEGQPSFDKQFLRDYLSTLAWNKQPPPPPLPAEILEKTRIRYEEALARLIA